LPDLADLTQFSKVDFGKERRADTSPTDIPFSITSRAASSRNSFVYWPCGIFSMDDTSVLSPYKFSKLWCLLFSTYLNPDGSGKLMILSVSMKMAGLVLICKYG
jgi:hypothetical protein